MEHVRLTGPRLILREYRQTPEDAEALYAVLGDPVAGRFLPAGPRDEEECADQIELYLDEAEQRPRGCYRLAVTLRAEAGDPVPIGQAALTRDGETAGLIGYALRPDRWGLGYAGEIAALLCGFGFERLGLHRLAARVDPDNTASVRVLTRAGFRLEGRIREDTRLRGQWRDSLQYSLLAAEWAVVNGSPPRTG
ncbi:GNAT family N-acetyltransferase [Kitasatospora camelliae]|uniref:GNAT family protein n=1 Tax=Kitasatospora camelliae TaxID=3156397 RepID=A0AAU8K0F3_9ACTN